MAPAQAEAEVPSIPHDQVEPFAEVEPVTRDQVLQKRFQPYLYVRTGCVPFPGHGPPA